MKILKIQVIMTVLLLYAVSAIACIDLTEGGADVIADAIMVEIQQLQQNDPNAVHTPTLLIKIAENFGVTDISSISVDASIASQVRNLGCVDRNNLPAKIRSAIQRGNSNVAFVSEATHSEIRNIVNERIREIGVGNIDPDTRSRLRARSINYVIIIGGRIVANESRCTFKFQYEASFDVHSIARLEVRSGSATANLQTTPDNYLRIGVQHRRIVLRTQLLPVCLGDVNVRISTGDSTNPFINSLNSNYNPSPLQWNDNIGCIQANSFVELSVPAAISSNAMWPTTGEIKIQPTSNCDEFRLQDVSLQSNFGLPSGSPINMCGCWGPVHSNTFTWAGCASGTAIIYQCFENCPGGGFKYRTVCQ